MDDDLIRLLEENARTPDAVLAKTLGTTEEHVRQRIEKLLNDRVILGCKAIVDDERAGREMVKAVIEVSLTPERDGGFNRLAERIAKYPEVLSCYLMSGGYDLLVTIQGRSLREVALFVSEKLSTIAGVRSTATHFMLKTYKEMGVMHSVPESHHRLQITP
jgi:DNA-binding Lrp family transcriptional regulator